MLSVIIPTWNEADHIARTIGALRANAGPTEVLVVDAGSHDGTREAAARLGCRVVESAVRQRAAQLNFGARASSGDLLLFLHADTRIPPSGLSELRHSLNNPGIVGGCFSRRFDSPSILLRLTCRAADVRARRLGWFLGDQGIFARRSAFETLGGFAEWPVFEDLDFSRRLRRLGRTVCLEPRILSSARRFQRHGPLLTSLQDAWLTVLFLSGTPPGRLAERAARLRSHPTAGAPGAPPERDLAPPPG